MAHSVNGNVRKWPIADMLAVLQDVGFQGAKQTSNISAAMSVCDPDVWSGRALQENFVELAESGLASMYPASHDGISVKS